MAHLDTMERIIVDMAEYGYAGYKVDGVSYEVEVTADGSVREMEKRDLVVRIPDRLDADRS